MWTRESLHRLVAEKFRDYLFVVVSNREPYVHSHAFGAIHCDMPPSGLTTALDPDHAGVRGNLDSPWQWQCRPRNRGRTGSRSGAAR